MSNFLQLCQRVVNIIGIQGTIATVSNPVGIHRNIVEAVRTSWVEIQELRTDWPFMLGEVTSFNTIADQSTYTPTQIFGSASAALDLKTWKRKRGCFYEEQHLAHVNFEDLPFIDQSVSQRPQWYSIDYGTNNLIFEKPNDAYNIVIRYKRTPHLLTNDADVLRVPTAFERAVVYKAVEKVAAYIGRADLHQQYSREGNKAIMQMMREYLPARYIRPRRFF